MTDPKVSEVEIRFELPKFPPHEREITIPDGDIKVIYRGGFYDLEAKFMGPTPRKLNLYGRPFIRRIDLRKELKQNKDPTSFQTAGEVEVPNEVWTVSENDKKSLHSGSDRHENYLDELVTLAYNHGIWLNSEKILVPIFNDIERDIKIWYKEVYKMFNIEVSE